MSSIGDIVANLGLNSTGFISGLRTSITMAKTFGDGIQRYGTMAITKLQSAMWTMGKVGGTVFGGLLSKGRSSFGMLTSMANLTMRSVKSVGGSVFSTIGRSMKTMASSGISLTSTMIGGLTKMLGPLALVAAGVAATFAVGHTIGAAKTQLNAENAVKASQEASGNRNGLSFDQIAAFASERQSKTNFGDETTLKAAATLNTMENVKGDTYKDVLRLSQDFAALKGQDLGPAVEKIGKAINSPIEGIGALADAGVYLTKRQKEIITEMTNAGNIQGAQSFLIAQLEKTVGGTAEKMADPWIMLQNTIGDIAELVGFMLLPSINIISKTFNDMLGPVASNREAADAWGVTLAKITSDYIVPMIQFLAVIYSYGVYVLGILWEWYTAAAATTLNYFTPMAELMWSYIEAGLQFLAVIYQWATATDGYMSGALAPIIGFLEGMLNGAKEIGDTIGFSIRNGVSIATIALIDLLLQLMDIIPYGNEVATAIASSLIAAWAAIKAGAKATINWIVAGFKEIMNMGQAVASGIKGIWDAIWNGDNPVEAARKGMDAFTKELASQKDIDPGVNPFTVMKEAYNTTKAQMDKQFQNDGGLANTLKKQKEALQNGIANSEVEYNAKIKVPDKPVSLVPTMVMPDLSKNKINMPEKKPAGNDQLLGTPTGQSSNKASLVNTSEGANEILRALSGGAQQKLAQQQADALKAIEESSAESAESNRIIKNKLTEESTVLVTMDG